MKVTRFVERHFWLVIAIAALAGLVLPGMSEIASSRLVPNLRYLIMSLLFMVLVRVDVADVVDHMKDVRFLAYIAATFLVVSPALLYFATLPFGDTVALAVLILSATPTGASSATFADLIGGNPALAASMTVLNSLLAPLTMPFVLGTLTGSHVDLDRSSLFISVATTLFVPIALSRVVRRWFGGVSDFLHPRASALNVLTLFFVCFAPVSANRSLLLERPARLLGQLAVVVAAFVLLHLMGYLVAPGRSRRDRLALASARAYMNLGLAILIAADHYSPEILTVVVIGALPWSTLVKPFEMAARRLPIEP